MTLQKPEPFKRKGRRLPGQASDDDLGLESQIRIVHKPVATVWEQEFIRLGNSGAGQYVEINIDGLAMVAGGKVHIDIRANGDLLIGQDTADPAKTYLAIFANDQSYNGESMSAGDMLIGDNSSGKANILWDKSAGQMNFRGGQNTAAYVDTDGSLTAGGGDVMLDAGGLSLVAGDSEPSNRIKFFDGTDKIGELYSNVDAGGLLFLNCFGKDSGAPEAILEILAGTYDLAAHGGAATVGLSFFTEHDRIDAYATTFVFSKSIRLMPMTTTTRNSLPAADGTLVYNTTAGKFQGYASGAWVDLH